MDEIYNSYYNAFLAAITQRLKPGFGVVTTYFPYDNGCVIVFELKKGGAHHKEKKAASSNVSAALLKASLISKEQADTINGKTVEGTLVTINSINRYVVIKSNNMQEWTDGKANEDFQKIYSKLLEKYGKQ